MNSTEKLKLKLPEYYNPDAICWIAGGGPSLKPHIPVLQEIFKDAKTHNVIACNNSYKIFPMSILCHFADRQWLQWHSQTLFTEFKNPTSTTVISTKYEDPKLELFLRGERFWLSKNKSVLNGNNTGHQALNLAIHLGYKDIRLLGFDLDIEAQETHWHTEHLRATNKGNFEATMIPGFQSVTKDFYDESVTITNCNPNSKITIFPFLDMNKWLESGTTQL